MARTLTLEPKFIEGRNKPWQLWIPAELSDTGRVKRTFYRTQREAETAANLVKSRAKNFGHNAVSLSPARMTIAAEAFELIGDRPDVALLELVRTALGIEARQSASVPWATLIDEFLETKQTRSPKHRRNLRYTREGFQF